MKNGGSIQIQQEHMTSLQADYDSAIKLLEKMKEELKHIQSGFASSYKGLADDIYTECLSKYLEHVHFLELCCTASKEYIGLSSESITTADRKTSFQMERVK